MEKLNNAPNRDKYSKFLKGIPRPLWNSRAELKLELDRIFQVERKLPVTLKFADVVTNYMKQDNDDIYLASKDWPRIAKRFLVSLGMSTAHAPDQFEIHDHMLILSEAFTGFNNVLLGVTREFTIVPLVFIEAHDCVYIGEHLMYADNSFHCLMDKLPNTSIDSSVLRHMNIGLEHSLIAFKITLQGIAKLCRKIDEDLVSESETVSPRHKYGEGLRDKT
ncbi:PREDICTED: uncharacterized protein LOC101310842 [Fragaria vesca subsp. vesca]|uniref:uncharacterized protein LOC101310842 n=1 Tax=Fragaria vesca subsp. vesca TaxID=101020 RepID=UPI0002C31F4B|nr:PREDICTED: uncharacterized protein LOC101310842 [Fragaria vesca subsp. vesca]